MRLVIARCSVDYAGRLSAHLPLATRLLMVKADGSVLVHSDSLSYKPLNWMSPPSVLTVVDPEPEQAEAGVTEVWKVVQGKTSDLLLISVHEVLHDSAHELGIDPGLTKDGVELLPRHVDVHTVRLVYYLNDLPVAHQLTATRDGDRFTTGPLKGKPLTVIAIIDGEPWLAARRKK